MPASSPGALSLLRHRRRSRHCSSSLVDFDRINASEMRFSVGATNVKTGNFVYFDNTTHKIGPAHVMASGSLPPGFPATEVDGEYLLGRRHRLQHAAAMGARRPAARRHARLPGRSVERARRAAARHDRGRRCARRTSAFRAAPAPAPTTFRKMQALRRAAAKLLDADAGGAAPDARGRAAGAGSRPQGLQHHPPDLSRPATTRARRRTTSSRAARWRSTGRPATATWRAPCVIPRCSQRPKSPDGVFTFDLKHQGANRRSRR